MAKQNDSVILSNAKNGDIKALETNLKNITNINIQDSSGKTALFLAVERNDMKMSELLLKNGADVNIYNKMSDTPFLFASANGKTEILKLMFKYAKVDLTKTNRFGGTGLIPACERGHLQTAQLLMQEGVNVDHINRLGWTCLLEIVILGGDSPNYVDIVKSLIQHKADLNIRDKEGKTALYYAQNKNYSHVASVLKQHGATL